MMDGMPGFGWAAFLPNRGLPALSSGSCTPPCRPFSHSGPAYAHKPPQLQAAAGKEHFPGFEGTAFVEEATHRVWCPAWERGQPPLPPLSHHQ